MGAAIARELHDRGYRLGLMSPSGSAVDLAAELGGVGIKGSAGDAKDLEALVAKTVEAFGRVDAVVNFTGHPPKGDLLDITDENWAIGNDLMVLSVVRMARLVTPYMLKQGKGAWVNLTTFAAFEPSLVFPVSCAYRAAVGAYTKLYSDRYGGGQYPHECAILPGYIDSLDHKPGTEDKVPDEAAWHHGGDRQDHGVPAVRRCGLHHRPEHSRRWRRHAARLRKTDAKSLAQLSLAIRRHRRRRGCLRSA